MMTKWDTIQADIASDYRHLDELEAIDKHNSETLFTKDMIMLDHLSDKQLDEISTMFGKEND